MKLRKMTAVIHGVSEVLNDCDGNPIDLYVQAGQPDAAGFNECHLASIFLPCTIFGAIITKNCTIFSAKVLPSNLPGKVADMSALAFTFKQSTQNLR
jgi:hypothetical protein